MTRLLALALLTLAVAVPPQVAKEEVAPAGVWQEAPAYLQLFAPAGPRAAAYRIYVSALDLRAVLDRLAPEPSLLRPPGAWSPAAVLPIDAFSQTGAYDRSKLARLYGSRRATVARGPRASTAPGASGRPTEAWTLISPYPSRDMDRLEPGTMLIVVNLAFP